MMRQVELSIAVIITRKRRSWMVGSSEDSTREICRPTVIWRNWAQGMGRGWKKAEPEGFAEWVRNVELGKGWDLRGALLPSWNRGNWVTNIFRGPSSRLHFARTVFSDFNFVFWNAVGFFIKQRI